MSMFTSTRWAARQTVRAIVEFKGLFLMALSLAGLALTIPFFLATLAWSLSSQVFNVPTQAEVTIFADRSAGEQSVKELAEAISANSVISDVRIMPKEDALAMVNQSLGLKTEDQRTKEKAKNNPLPDIIIATVASNVSSEELAAAWRPYVETCIEAFGPNRCMFESNFPPDKGQCSYQVIFNTFKRLASQYSEVEKTALFLNTAKDVYRLDIG